MIYLLFKYKDGKTQLYMDTTLPEEKQTKANQLLKQGLLIDYEILTQEKYRELEIDTILS